MVTELAMVLKIKGIVVTLKLNRATVLTAPGGNKGAFLGTTVEVNSVDVR